MSLRDMRTFVEVVQSGSFALAADRLGISPSVVSKQIGALETKLGARLLNRTTRSMAVTDIGEAFFDSCRDVLGRVENIEQEVALLQGTAKGHLTIRVTHSIGILHLGKIITEFCKIYPAMSVSIAIDEFPLHSFEMVERRSGIVLHLGPVTSPNVVARELTQVIWLPHAAPDYLAQHGTPQTPADLKAHNCLVHQVVFPTSTWTFRGPDGETSVEVGGTISANSVLILREAAENGFGVALLPSFCNEPAVANGTLVRLLPDHVGPERHLYVVYEADRMLPRATRLFIDYMLARMKSPPWGLGRVPGTYASGARPQTVVASPAAM
jgi:DNA-binding transcriptional LysR family regulator